MFPNHNYNILSYNYSHNSQTLFSQCTIWFYFITYAIITYDRKSKQLRNSAKSHFLCFVRFYCILPLEGVSVILYEFAVAREAILSLGKYIECVNAEWFVSSRLLRRLTIITSLWKIRFTPASKRSTHMPIIEPVTFLSAIANGVINSWFGDLGFNSCLGLHMIYFMRVSVELMPSQHLARFAVDPSSREPKNSMNFVHERHFEMTHGRTFNSSLAPR